MRKSSFAVVVLLGVVGCSSVRSGYYNAWEKMGYSKRERLVENVTAANQEQNKAKEQFVSALEQFKAVTKFQGGDLEAVYNKLNGEYEGCKSRAEAVKSKIVSVKNVGDALFAEWKDEVSQIKDDDALQKQSQALLDKTKGNYKGMIDRMDKAARSMDPVLTKFKNRVIFVKSNLNAQAIGSLAGTEADLTTDINKLVAEMEKSIAEADTFIASLKSK